MSHIPDFTQIDYESIALEENAPQKKWAHLQEAAPGQSPYLRGPYATMYVQRPWTLRQYAGFSTAEKSNAFYQNNLNMGQHSLSVAFDLPTHRGYDSDHPKAQDDVGKAGVAIDSVEDMHRLFADIPLEKMSVSMTMNGAVIPIMAFYLVVAEEQGADIKQLRGTLQNDILKEFIVRNTYIYPPKASLRIVTDILAYVSKEVPLFHGISISGYHMHEAGAPAALELAYTLANGMTYVNACAAAKLDVHTIASRVSFFWGTGMKFLEEIAKLRAGRYLWATLLEKEGIGTKEKGRILKAHTQTSGWSLTAQDPYNNVSRTCMEAMSAVLGHTQSLHTNALDEALSLPTDFSANVARQTQLYLMKELALGRVIDPFGGSEAVESLTASLITQASMYLEELESYGGMLSAIEAGIPKQKIEEFSVKKQALIDRGKEKIVGVNSWQAGGRQSHEMEILDIDNAEVLATQQSRLESLRAKREESRVQETLHALVQGASKNGNILSLAIEAARARATLGEISSALKKVFGRHRTQQETVQGIYKDYMAESNKKEVWALCDAFEKQQGRRPRVLLAKLGQDGHDRGYRLVGTALADLGFDVDMSPLFQTPESVAKQAIENDVHGVGVSILSAGHKTLIPKLIQALKQRGREDICVWAGGVIPAKDHAMLHEAGVKMIFGTGSVIYETAKDILHTLRKCKGD